MFDEWLKLVLFGNSRRGRIYLFYLMLVDAFEKRWIRCLIMVSQNRLNNSNTTIVTPDENDVIVDVVTDDDDQPLTDALQSSHDDKRKISQHGCYESRRT